MPGGVDPHTHFDLPMFGTVSSDDHYTGHKAAAFGGTTTVMDFVSFDEPTHDEPRWRHGAGRQRRPPSTIGFHMNLTRFDRSDRRPRCRGCGQRASRHSKSSRPTTAACGCSDGAYFQGPANCTGKWHAGHGPLRERRCDRDADLRGAGGGAHQPRVACPHSPRVGWCRNDDAHGRDGRAGGGARLHRPHECRPGRWTCSATPASAASRQWARPARSTCSSRSTICADRMAPSGFVRRPCAGSADNARLWAGPARRNTADHRHRSLSVLLRWNTTDYPMRASQVKIPGKELGRDDFTKIPNGLPGRAGSAPGSVDVRRSCRKDHGQPVRGVEQHESSSDLWTVSAQG